MDICGGNKKIKLYSKKCESSFSIYFVNRGSDYLNDQVLAGNVWNYPKGYQFPSTSRYTYWEIWSDLEIGKNATQKVNNLKSIYVNLTLPANSLDGNNLLGLIAPGNWNWGATFTPAAPALPINLEFFAVANQATSHPIKEGKTLISTYTAPINAPPPSNLYAIASEIIPPTAGVNLPGDGPPAPPPSNSTIHPMRQVMQHLSQNKTLVATFPI